MNKELKEQLKKRASEFQLGVWEDLAKVSYDERNTVANKLQMLLFEFFESSDSDLPIGMPSMSFESEDKIKQDEEKKALIEKLRKFINKHGLSYATASTKLEISAGPLYNWLNGHTLPNRISFNKLKEGLKKLIAEVSMKKNEENEDDIKDGEVR